MSAACDEARDALTDGDPSDPAGADRVRRHRATCAACRAFAARIDGVAAPVRRAEAPLDDMARARIASKLGPALDEIATRHAARTVRRSPWRNRAVWAAATVAAAAAIVILIRIRQPGTLYDRGELALLQPFVIAGSDGELLDRRLETIAVPAGGLVRATLAGRARITLIGPARLTVAAASPSAIALRLDEGTLLGAYEHQAGGTLTVESPGYTTRVVGTLFAVTVENGETRRVAVARGTVELLRGETLVGRINAGWGFVPGGAALHAIRSDLRALLDEHDAVLPPSGPAGILRIAGTPEHADVISGARLGPAPLAARVSVGEVELAVRALGHGEARFRSPVARDQTTTLSYGLAPSVAPAPIAQLPPPPITSVPSKSPPIASVPSKSPSPPIASVPSKSPSPPIASVPSKSPAPPIASVPSKSPAPPIASVPSKPPIARDPAAAPPSVSPGEPASAPAAPETADQLYARAEAEKRAGSPTRAHALLAEVVSRFPDDALANSALYELGRDAHAAHDDEHARAFLDELLARGGDSSLREPARYLRCRIDLDAKHDAVAMRCLQAFRRDYPSSPHDAEALALLAALAQSTGDCALARPLLDEYLRSYPTGPFAADARARRARCQP